MKRLSPAELNRALTAREHAGKRKPSASKRKPRGTYDRRDMRAKP